MAFSHNHAPLAKYGKDLALPPLPPTIAAAAARAAASAQVKATAPSAAGAIARTAASGGGIGGAGPIKAATPLPAMAGPLGQLATEAERQMAVWAAQNLAVAAWGQAALDRELAAQWEHHRPHSHHHGGDGSGAAVYRWLRIEDFDPASAEGVGAYAHAVAGLATPKSRFSSSSLASSMSPSSSLSAAASVGAVIAELRGTPLGSFDPKLANRAKSRAGSAASDETAGAGIGGGGAATAKQYGKWRSLAGPEEQAVLAAIGGEALAHFGYI